MDELEFYNGQLTGEEIDKRIIRLSMSIGELPYTFNSEYITSKHIVLHWVFGTPIAQQDEWTVTTTNGSLTITGTLLGATTLWLVLGIPQL